MTKQKKISVAAYIRVQIAVSGIPQTEIAAALNYDKPNVITMIKQGKTKLPLNKVGPLAKVLGIDPVDLLRRVMAEYMPDTWVAIQDMVGRALVSEGEMEIIRLVRANCVSLDVSLGMPSHRAPFIKLIQDIGYEQFQHALKGGSSPFMPKHR